MIKITKKVTIIIMILTIFLLAVEAKSGDKLRYSNASAYETADRWYKTECLIAELNGFETDKPVTLRIKAKKRYKNGLFLVIKKKRLTVKAYTKNKVIFYNDRGNKYVFIPVEDVIEGEDVSLHLIPKKGKTGKITDTPRIQSKNDFYFNLLQSQRKTVVFLLALFTVMIFETAKKRYLTSLLFAMLIILTFCTSPLAPFIIGLRCIQYALTVISLLGAVYCFTVHILIAIKYFIC